MTRPILSAADTRTVELLLLAFAVTLAVVCVIGGAR